MTVRTEIADPGTRETLEGLLSFCGIPDGFRETGGVLRITDTVPEDVPAAEECAVCLVPRGRAGEPDTASGSGGRVFLLPVPVLLEEGVLVLTEAVRALGRAGSAEREEAVRRPETAGEQPSPKTDAEEFPAVSPDGLTVSWRGRTVRLTPREADCFRILYARRGETVSREELAGPEGSRSNLADVYIGYLRRKLRPLFGDGAILAVRGKGYLLKLP